MGRVPQDIINVLLNPKWVVSTKGCIFIFIIKLSETKSHSYLALSATEARQDASLSDGDFWSI